MTKSAFLDSSVLIDALYPSHADRHERAAALLGQVRDGMLALHITATVLFEAAYVLEKRYGLPRQLLTEAFRSLIALPSISLPEIDVAMRAIAFWEQQSPLSFADCYHLVLAESLGLDAIYAFDKKMGRYPGVERLEP
jgi:predicted nucleic acid-binding protein